MTGQQAPTVGPGHADASDDSTRPPDPADPAPERSRTPARIQGWLLGWAVAALVAAPALGLLFDRRDDVMQVSGGAGTLLLLVLLAFFAQLGSVEVNRARSTHVISLIEAALTTALLLVGGVWAFAVTVLAVGALQVTRTRPWFKAAFNTSQVIVAGAVAAAAYELVAPESIVIGWQHVAAVLVASLVFGITNWVAVMGVLTRFEGRSVWQKSPQSRVLSTFSTAGNVAVGVVAAVLWRARPDLAVLAAIPLLSIYLAYRGIASTRASLEREHAQTERLARVLDAAEEGVIVLGPRGAVELWSPAMTRLTGIAAEEAVGLPVELLLQPRTEGGDPITIRPERRTSESTLGAWRIDDVDGQPRDMAASVTTLFDDGDEVGTVILLRDVTRQREVERLKDDFLMRVSHELRTPLTPIRGFAQTLLTHHDRMSSEQFDSAITTIIERSDHLTRMVDDLLLVSTRTQKSPPDAATAVDVDTVVDDVVATSHEAHPDRTIEVARTEPADQWATTRPLVQDAAGVTRILEILLDNALRYSQDHTPVRLEMSATEDGLEFAVIDRGRGIPSDQIEQIFERFHRVEDPMVMTTGGVGVGLFIARRLARQLGGDVTATSELDKGSTFRLQVPTLTTDETATDPTSVAMAS